MNDEIRLINNLQEFVKLTISQIDDDGKRYLDDFDRGRIMGLEDVEEYLTDLEVDAMTRYDLALDQLKEE
jgi:hypothetical protein